MNVDNRSVAALLVFLSGSPVVAIPAWATASVAPPMPSQVQPTQTIVPFDGTWEGLIHFDKEAFLVATSTPPEGTNFRIEISGPVVRVFIVGDKEIEEAKPGAFHLAAVGANAVIFGTDQDVDIWVESWTFVMTQKDDHTVTVEYSRLVNNVGASPDDPQKIFGTRGVGEFKRVTP